MSDPIVRPSTCGALAYQCFARVFPESSYPVLFLIASGFQPVGDYQLFFKSDGGFHWTLFERVPRIFPELTTWYVASATTSQPVLDVPATVSVTDSFGTHSLPVVPWESKAMQTGAAAEAAPGTVQPSHGLGIDYKVFSRAFDGESAAVLFLLASCYYTTGGWKIHFEGAGKEGWVLLETVPGIVNFLITYYEASFTTAFALLDPPAVAAIRDGWGVHEVPVTPWS